MDEVGLEGVYRPEKLQFWLMVRPQKSSRLGEVLDNVIVFCRILWNEGLSVSVCLKEACDCLIFRGISLPNNDPILSHLMYADDLILEIGHLVSILQYEPAYFPFKYLDLSIGANLKVAKNWNPIIENFKIKLTIWKAKNLSFGGRFTIVKSVLGSLSLFYFSLFKAPKKKLLEFWKALDGDFPGEVLIIVGRFIGSFGRQLLDEKSWVALVLVILD
uniref:Reverse transcriptase domain-containing protein n=1 Tax=Lactuca sativa TaxID=4236 RepID=A0A9R1V9K4_LACSA|nr:hypothetical protein LSAT_V11C600334430 [Lactuca sativa]